MEYLIQHGTSAFLGRFAPTTDAPRAIGETVVVRSVRGVETGTILLASSKPIPGAFAGVLGEVLPEAVDVSIVAQRTQQANALLTLADRLAPDVLWLDAEVLYDGSGGILHGLNLADAEAEFTRISSAFGVPVVGYDPSPAPEPKGCETCGSTEGGGCSTGGCSSGNCSRGEIKSADSMTAYFQGLRERMHSSRVPLLS